MIQNRRQQIIDLIASNGAVKSVDLMKRFDISIETVRRDLEYLENQGYLQRVYGGAALKRSLGAEPAYTSREKAHAAEKEAIAEYAASMVQDDDTLFLDQGTTVLAMARRLRRNLKISVLTNSVRTAIALSELSNALVILTGGVLRAQELSLSGFPAEQCMERFNIDKAFIGAGGVTANGVTDFHTEESSLRIRAIENAERVIALADSSKLGIRAMNNICRMEDVDTLVTDDASPERLLKEIEKLGVRVVRCAGGK